MCSVQVLIPSYNAEATLGRAITSVLRQQRVQVRVLVIDHGSSDRTVSIAEAFDAPVSVHRVIRKPNERRSASRPLNVGLGALFEQSPESNWIMRLDSDDILASDDALHACLAAASQVASAGHAISLVCGGLAFFDSVHATANSYGVRPAYRNHAALVRGAAYSLPHHSILLSAKLVRQMRHKRGFWYGEDIGYGEDFDFSLAALHELSEHEIFFADKIVTYKHLHANSVTSTTSAFAIANDHIRIFRRHRGLRRSLLARTLFDLLLQRLTVLPPAIRMAFGFPGLSYGFWADYDFRQIEHRLAELAASPVTVRINHGS